jgi:hypothetical protein
MTCVNLNCQDVFFVKNVFFFKKALMYTVANFFQILYLFCTNSVHSVDSVQKIIAALNRNNTAKRN